MSERSRRAFFIAAVVLGARGFSAAGDDPAKEYAALEEAFETAPLAWPDQYAAFRPKYEAFAKAHPGTDSGLAAKMRLLQFAGALDGDAEHEEAARRLDDVLADNPRSVRLAELPAMWYLFADNDSRRMWDALRAPEQPDAVKAAVLLYDAQVALHQKKYDEADAKLREIVEKYAAVPHGFFTFGEYADSLRRPTPVVVDVAAPDIVGKSVDGKAVKLSGFRGRVVLLCFFNGGFGSGKDTYSEEKGLAEKFKADKFTMFFVSQTSSPTRMRALAKTEKLTWPTVFDGDDGPISNRWEIDAWPKWYLIDDLGIVRRIESGKPAFWAKAAIDELLTEAKRRRK